MVTMKQTPHSSSIGSHGYDAATGVLSIHFKGAKKRYDYQNVPPEVARAFESAPSLGQFHAAHIKGKYHHETVETA